MLSEVGCSHAVAAAVVVCARSLASATMVCASGGYSRLAAGPFLLLCGPAPACGNDASRLASLARVAL